ncbi:MAG: sugar ABC transporter permease [Candidatus Borkfalkiaceae bacterium]|nr:sugar ABC transporter permease [Christensenellaceae bacterium]
MKKAYNLKSILSDKKTRDLTYYIFLLVLPFLQFFIFYVVVNFNSIILSFKRFELTGYTFKFVHGGFENYKQVFADIARDAAMGTMLKNSGIAYLSGLLITTPLALFFSYYIMKRFKGSGFFRVILFLPTIVSSVITVFMFKIMCDNIIPELIKMLFYKNSPDFDKGSFMFLTRMDTRFTAVLFYSIFVGFGTNVLLYTGAMSGTDDSMMEAAAIDGVSDIKEFLFIIFPCVYPTLTTFLVCGVAGFFTNQLFLFPLYDTEADPSIRTLGYYMYIKSIDVKGVVKEQMYPYLSALGVVFTLIATPITLLVKFVLEKIGPSED